MKNRGNRLRIGAMSLAILVASGVGYYCVNMFMGYMTDYPNTQRYCYVSGNSVVLEYDPAFEVSSEFLECAQKKAELYITYDYPEVRDHARAFLTLISAIFIGSIAFSDKIVSFGTAGWWSRTFMILCWILLFGSIVGVGTGLVGITGAYYYAVHEPLIDFEGFAGRAFGIVFGAGVVFGCGLLSLLLAGIASFLERTAHASAPVGGEHR